MKSKIQFAIGLFSVLIFTSSCEVFNIFTDRSGFDVTPREQTIQKRAEQMGRIKWLTQNEIPAKSKPIPPGALVTGIPYSSVKEVGGYVGFDISFYTFLSAVANPRSVLYTEDLSSEHYNSTNATTYYGTVCSSTVSYALGFDLPYSTADIPNLPYVSRLESQCVDSLKIGDMLWRTGHVMMVYDKKYSGNGELTHISILESASGTSISSYTCNKLKTRIQKEKMEAFRSSRDVDATTFEFDTYDDSRTLKLSLCPNKGDKSVYCKNSDITMNVLDSTYTTLTLLKDGVQQRKIPVENEDITLSNLDEGMYEAFLSNADSFSNPVSFEVMNTELSYEDLGEEYRIFFDNKYGCAEYIFYVSETGSMEYCFEVTENDLINGYKDVAKVADGSLFLRFVIRGNFGRAYSSFISM